VTAKSVVTFGLLLTILTLALPLRGGDLTVGIYIKARRDAR
jgi:hypothetical protein